MLKVNDFFCGAGGMGLGFKQAGFRLAGAWDFDKYAVESYGNNVSPKVKQMDISEMIGEDVPYADVWTFGFPCQDISIAGKQAGMVKGKTRSGLFYEVMRLLEEVEEKPRIILAENVKMVKKYLPEIEKEYKEHGYKMVAKLLNSKYWGVPQNRERYFIVGVREDIEKEFEFPIEQNGFIPSISTVLENEVEERFLITDERALKIMGESQESGIKISHAWRSREFEASGMKDVAPTVCARDYKDPQNVWDFNKSVLRKATPREYARLQGFPESFEFVVSNTQLYKQFGNAVTVNVSTAIAKKISEFLANSQS